MKQKLSWFLLGSLAIWMLAAVPAWLWQGESALLETAVALALCFLPMTGSMIWLALAHGGSPDKQLVAAMGGSGLRLVFVLVAGVLLHRNVALLSEDRFLLWVVFFYLTTLALEIVIVVRSANGELKDNLPVQS